MDFFTECEVNNEFASKYFGFTTNWNQAGYLLTNGKMLDFSDGQGNKRVLDHRDIKDIIDIDKDRTGVLAMIQFINYGNIRMSENGIELSAPLTNLQKKTLSSYLPHMMEFFVDIADKKGRVIQTFTFHYPIFIQEISQTIEDYFDTLTHQANTLESDDLEPNL